MGLITVRKEIKITGDKKIMNIDNYEIEIKLREIMYSVLGYQNKNGFWCKPKPKKKQHCIKSRKIKKKIMYN